MMSEDIREMTRNNYVSQMDTLGYSADGIRKDMVEIVRCKDCKWFHQAFENEGRCIKHDNDFHKPEWFCADGERKSADKKLMEEMDADPLG